MVSVVKISERETRLVVAGEMYGENAADLEKQLESVMGITAQTITLDLSLATGITSSALGKIVRINGRLNAESRELRIVGCSESLFRLFKMMKLDELIPIARGQGSGTGV